MALNLPNITICVADCANHELAARALRLSAEKCKFGDAILFSDIEQQGPFRNIKIDKLSSLGDYSAFLLKLLIQYIDTPYVLIIQWDGYVTDPTAWNEDFLNYDYIGARWARFSDAHNIGNGGFSLRSRKLLQALADPIFATGGTEDIAICRDFRPILERDYNIKFAPELVAKVFSYETEEPSQPTFGFHGLWNLWRYIDDAELPAIIEKLAPYNFSSISYLNLMIRYFKMRNINSAFLLYKKLRENIQVHEMIELLKNNGFDTELILQTIHFGESGLAKFGRQ